MIHRLYLLMLAAAGVCAVVSIALRNYDYYLLPPEERPFHERYEALKPSGVESHGYGVAGTVMIVAGVAMYSARKRVRRLARVGKIRNILEFHIFLCLLGPILVLYHTTFKFGGIVAVSFWSMMAVVASGIVGRYLYVQIPKGIHGNELTVKELEEERRALVARLEREYGLSPEMIGTIDALCAPKRPGGRLTSARMLGYLVVSDITRRRRVGEVRRYLRRQKIDARSITGIAHIAARQSTLARRIAFLERIQRLFHYWHVVHLPFSIIMFAILIIHIAVAVAFGYTWIL